MAYLVRTGYSRAGCTSATVSIWFQYDGQDIENAVCSYPLFTIGDPVWQDSAFWMGLGGNGLSTLTFSANASGQSIYGVYPQYVCNRIVTSPDTGVSYGSWHHVLISFDIGDGAGYSVKLQGPEGPSTYLKPFRMIFDGVDAGVYNVASGFVWASNAAHRSQPGGIMQISNTNVTLPGWTSDTPHAHLRRYADVQVWMGTYMDPAIPAVFAKFIKITGGRGYPVDPLVTAAAFGTQTFLFRGKASDSTFFTNRGNGGTFTKVGTASDFTPTPSY